MCLCYPPLGCHSPDVACAGCASLLPNCAAILRTPVLRGFGTGQEVEGHEQTALDFAPGDFVEILTSSNDWEIAQVNDVVEVPWHQLRYAIASHDPVAFPLLVIC